MNESRVAGISIGINLRAYLFSFSSCLRGRPRHGVQQQCRRGDGFHQSKWSRPANPDHLHRWLLQSETGASAKESLCGGLQEREYFSKYVRMHFKSFENIAVSFGFRTFVASYGMLSLLFKQKYYHHNALHEEYWWYINGLYNHLKVPIPGILPPFSHLFTRFSWKYSRSDSTQLLGSFSVCLRSDRGSIVIRNLRLFVCNVSHSEPCPNPLVPAKKWWGGGGCCVCLMWHFVCCALNWVFGFGFCHIRHINIDNECFRIYFTCCPSSDVDGTSLGTTPPPVPPAPSPIPPPFGHPLPPPPLSRRRALCAFNCHFHNFYIFSSQAHAHAPHRTCVLTITQPTRHSPWWAQWTWTVH